MSQGKILDPKKFFAVETSCFSLEDCINESIVIHETVNTLETLFRSKNVLPNLGNTKLIEFSYSDTSDKTRYENNDRTLVTVLSATFVKIIIHHRLDWRHHTDNFAKKISSYVYNLRNLASNIKTDTAMKADHEYTG